MSKYLGALALGLGAQALTGGLKNPLAQMQKGATPPAPGGDARTPGFFGQAGNALQTGFKGALAELPGQAIRGVLGFDRGGAVRERFGAGATFQPSQQASVYDVMLDGQRTGQVTDYWFDQRAKEAAAMQAAAEAAATGKAPKVDPEEIDVSFGGGAPLAAPRPRSEHTTGGYDFNVPVGELFGAQWNLSGSGDTRHGLGNTGLKGTWKFMEGGPVYADEGGFFNSLLSKFGGDAALAKAQMRADELNKVNQQLGLEGQLEATTDQSRLLAERQAIINEVLGRNRPQAAPAAAPAAAPMAAPTAAPGISPEQQALVDARMAEIDAGIAAERQKTRPDYILPPLASGYGADEAGRYATGGTALARKKNMPDGYTGATKKAPMDEDTVINGRFMSDHVPHIKKQGVQVGPLAKAVYKNEGGAVREMHYHNPLMAKPAGGKPEEK